MCDKNFMFWCQKTIPLVFDNSMSYYECLCKLLNYVNSLTTDVAEIAKLQQELQTYVENYFTNLDVQTEINNKLDEMAQSGELESIIGAYINANAVLGFNTINDLKSSESIINGSFCRTFGLNTLNDGGSSLYKIRNITSSDVVDNINIIALEKSDELIAEKIKFSNIEELNNFKNFSENSNMINGIFLGSFFDKNLNFNFMTSKDGYNFSQIPSNLNINKRDPSLIYFNEKFYIAFTGATNLDFTIYFSDDFINWEYQEINLNLKNLGEVWAPELFVNNNELYVFVSCGPENNKNIYYSKCTDITNLNFENASLINLNEINVIDPYVIKTDKYYLFVNKLSNNLNENTSSSIIFESEDLINWTKYNDNLFPNIPFNEGTCCLYINGTYLIYSDLTTSNGYYLYTQVQNLNEPIKFIKTPQSLINMRHGSIIYLTDENALNKIYNFLKNENNSINLTKMNYNTKIQLAISDDMDSLIIQPNILYQITGSNETITINNIYNPFKLDYFPFVFTKRSDAKLIINNIENTEGTIKAVNLTLNNSTNANEKIFNMSMIGNCYPPYIP